jgi:hypothetical protein
MVAEVFAGLGALKTAFDLAKGLKDINDATIRNAAVIELQEKILTAQQQQSALVESVSALEKEVADLKAWDGEKQRYELKNVGGEGPAVFAYALKAGEENGEPPHLLCANCYQSRRKSILQATAELRSRLRAHRCPSCKAEFEFSYVPRSPAPNVQRFNPLAGF